LDVFFYEAFLEEIEALKRHLPSGIDAGFTHLTIQESSHEQPPCPFISIRTQSVIPDAWAYRLEGILTRSTGFDHVKRFLGKSGKDVPSGYLPLYCSRSVAEQALMMWMALLRKLPRQMEQFGRFERDGLTGFECMGKTLLVVGVGNIGSEVYRIGEALGMAPLGVDIVRKHPDIRYVSIDEGIRLADIIVCAMNLTPDNLGYFNCDLLEKANPGVIFVNISRGELSPTKDLLHLLDGNHLGGVGLDVYDNESELGVSLRMGVPCSDEDVQACIELSKRGNAILTPHNAFNTHEALERKAAQSIEQVTHFLTKKTFIWKV
jgi:D-lactate dehydrogenase